MKAFCTIITSNYFPYAVTLYRSLQQQHKNEKLIVLVCDEGPIEPNPIQFENIQVIKIKDIYSYGEVDQVYNKYAEKEMDAFRWAMKPVFLRYLLESGFEKLIYTDCDIFFFNDYEFLFNELNLFRLLLTPCWRTIDYKKNEEEFIALYTDGLYNAGFIGVNKKSMDILQWWSKVCLYKTEINREQGLFVDQKYLDAVPLMFENVKSLTHKGCNVSLWNQNECERVYNKEQVSINGDTPVIFIHFNKNYIKELNSGNDHLLFPYFKQYEAMFAESGFQLNDFIQDLSAHTDPSLIQKIKRQVALRKRFKHLMQRLIDKI